MGFPCNPFKNPEVITESAPSKKLFLNFVNINANNL